MKMEELVLDFDLYILWWGQLRYRRWHWCSTLICMLFVLRFSITFDLAIPLDSHARHCGRVLADICAVPAPGDYGRGEERAI